MKSFALSFLALISFGLSGEVLAYSYATNTYCGGSNCSNNNYSNYNYNQNGSQHQYNSYQNSQSYYNHQSYQQPVQYQTRYQKSYLVTPVKTAYQYARPQSQTNYYHPKTTTYKTQTSSCNNCGTTNQSRTYFRDNMTPYKQRTTYYNKQTTNVYRNTNRQAYSCQYQQGR